MKIDLKAEAPDLYRPSAREVAIVEVPAFPFLMCDGAGDPNTAAAYREALDALYSVSYTLKFMLKKGAGAYDYAVMPLEGLWWMAGDLRYSPDSDRADWRWTAMIRQPDCVTTALLDEASAAAARKKALPALPLLRLEPFTEGRAAQIMHLGPYSAEGPTIARLHAFIIERGYRLRDKHHEVYLSDPRRTVPERLKTILRQPIA